MLSYVRWVYFWNCFIYFLGKALDYVLYFLGLPNFGMSGIERMQSELFYLTRGISVVFRFIVFKCPIESTRGGIDYSFIVNKYIN
jgi:hypothetical protein